MKDEASPAAAPLPDALRRLLAQGYGISLGQARQLTFGDECLIWRVASSRGPLVVRISPPWRSPVRLAWIHQVMRSLQDTLPQVVLPLETLDSRTLLRYGNQSVVLFPYVRGAHLDRERPRLRYAAATLLARLHSALLRQVPSAAPLERDLLIGTPPLPPAPDPDLLLDRELDCWHEALLQKPTAFTTGLIHGDYYRRNLLRQGERIIALLDWDDLHRDFLMQEVAWSTWELCKTSAGDDWHLTRVEAYLKSYQAAGGPCKPEEYATFIPFIRWRMRAELRRHFAAVASGLPGEPEYAARVLRAFHRLRGGTMSFI